MTRKVLTFAALAIVAGRAVLAQPASSSVVDRNLNTWWSYAGDHPIAGGWSAISEAEIRRSDFLRTSQQLIFREAAGYRFSPHVQVAAGYFWTRNARYGGFPPDHPFLEHRIFEQLSIHHTARRVDIDHRFHVEQRWLQDFSHGEAYFWRYQDRTRYQFRLTLPISKANASGQQWHLFAGDEIFFHFGPNQEARALNQNRVQAGIGCHLTRNNRIEIGYLNQYLLRQNGFVNESNHTLRFQFISSARLFGQR